MLQMSAQIDAAEKKTGVPTSDVGPTPGSDNAGDPAPVSDITEDPAPEEPAADVLPVSVVKKQRSPKKKVSQNKAPSKKKAPPKKAPPKTTGRMLLGLLVKLAVAAALVWAVFTFVLGLSVHYGNNMHPAVRDGDLVVSYRLQKPFINAVVLYRINGKTEVGRVIALEGSVVDIAENGLLTVNGAATSDEIFYATYQAENSPVRFPYTVETGKVFILNDFRNDTNDSRVFGAIDRKDLQGPLLFTARRRNF